MNFSTVDELMGKNVLNKNAAMMGAKADRLGSTLNDIQSISKRYAAGSPG